MTHDIGENYNKMIEGFWDSNLAKEFNQNRIYRKVYRIANLPKIDFSLSNFFMFFSEIYLA